MGTDAGVVCFFSVGCLHVRDFMASGTHQAPHARCWGACSQAETERATLLPHLSLILFFLLATFFQAYVSYDYGRSFKRISEKLNFGEGNSSEAVVAQFYHSPADNKRVRMSPLWLCRAAFGGQGSARGWLGDGTLGASLQPD